MAVSTYTSVSHQMIHLIKKGNNWFSMELIEKYRPFVVIIKNIYTYTIKAGIYSELAYNYYYEKNHQ